MVRVKIDRSSKYRLGVSMMRKPVILMLIVCLGMSCLWGAPDAAAQTVLPSIRPASVLPASPPSNEAEATAWSDPQPRKYLMQKAANFLEGGAGYYNINTDARRLSQGLITPQEVGKTQPTLPEQFNEVFGGVPSPEITLVGNYRLFEACQVHNCAVRAALVTDTSGAAVQAAGLIHYGCTTISNASNETTSQAEGKAQACEYIPTLTIFYESKQTKNAALTEQLIEWARAKVAARINAMKLSSKENNKLRIDVKFVHGP
jgi:hypothetical protein